MSEVESRTKIRAKYLRAIENEEWDLLPGPVYVKSFLRTYGDYLGLDSRMLVDEFKRRYERPSDHDATPIASLSRERDRDRDRDRGPRGPRGPLIPPWAVIGLVLIAIVVALGIIGNTGGGKKSPSPTGLNAGPHHRPRKKPKPRVTQPAAPQAVSLQLAPTGTVYVCLVNAHGTKLIDERTFTAGESVPNQSGKKLLLTLGNANIHVKVNGHAVPLAASPTAIRLLLTPTSTQHIALSMKPTCP